ncbi:hypothetical protein E1A91_A08G045000v1 [Gossypium mustelinum]|uniref:RING-type E3 ubiquitin transferase n=1 Tax=Gossypium mustelinum TaxID=34275 RepID=A0A5D2Y4I9_GOSMU|nr:hypothetical protein E1A91_A08G045000v1 [Gossypium mustelinum]
MASTPYQYDIIHHQTFEDNLISQSHDVAFVNIELTLDFLLLSVHHDCLADISTITNRASLRETFRFELDIMENQHLFHQSCPIPEVLPLRSLIHASIVEHDSVHNDGVLMGRALAESALEFGSSNYDMVPAKESLVKEMVKVVKVEAGDEEDCIICLEELEVGFYASQMPCSHTFHVDCIMKWLKQSHYCPICRFEMPTN